MYCPACGSGMATGNVACPSCGWREAPRPSASEDPSLRVLLPVGRPFSAIAAGYLGLLSPLVVFAPFALLTGVIALRTLRRHPELVGRGRAIFGVVMGLIFSLGAGALFLIGLLS